MRIKNLRNNTLVFGNISVERGQEADVPDSAEVRSMIKNGYVSARDVKITSSLPVYTLESLREKKEELGWKKFQKWAKEEFGVTDTSEEELYNEILERC